MWAWCYGDIRAAEERFDEINKRKIEKL